MDENDAYVQVLALVSSQDEYRAEIQHALDEMGFDLVELEDVELLSRRLRQWSVDELLLAKAREVEATGFPRFGSFHTWISDE
jgi:hypothetical protein